MPKIINFSVSSVLSHNRDGTSRQELISRCKVGDEVLLEHDPFARRKNTVKVLNKMFVQMGVVDYKVSMSIYPLFETGTRLTGRISRITSADHIIKGALIELVVPQSWPKLEQ